MKVPYADLWPLRRASAKRMTPGERAYRDRVKENKRRLKREANRTAKPENI
jgi:hypothetical protein